MRRRRVLTATNAHAAKMDIEVGAGATPGTAGANSTLSIENPSNPTPRNPIVVNSVSEVKPKKRTSVKGVEAGVSVSPALC